MRHIGPRPAFALEDVSDAGLDDTLALGNEADAIWADFRLEADEAGVSSAVLGASSMPRRAFIQHNRMFNIVYVEDSTGLWRRLPFER